MHAAPLGYSNTDRVRYAVLPVAPDKEKQRFGHKRGIGVNVPSSGELVPTCNDIVTLSGIQTAVSRPMSVYRGTLATVCSE